MVRGLGIGAIVVRDWVGLGFARGGRVCVHFGLPCAALLARFRGARGAARIGAPKHHSNSLCISSGEWRRAVCFFFAAFEHSR